MTAGLVLVLIIVGAYLAAHLVAEWLARRFLVVSGAEYLLLGVLVGPEVSGLISPSMVGGFAPFLTLALGWIGALVGAQFYIPDIIRIPAVLFRVAFTEALISGTVVGGLMAVVLSWQFGLSPAQVVFPAVALAAIATASAPAAVALVSRDLGGGSPVIRQLEVATAVDALVAVTTFGILLCLFHAPPPGPIRPPTPTEWAVITVAIGVVGGALFHLFLGPEQQLDRLFIALSGAIILASGAAAHLRLSPLLPTMLIGMVLVNTSRSREAIRQALSRIERPLYFVLLVFAGTAWQPGRAGWLLPVLAFLAIRLMTKLGSARLAARANGAHDVLGPGWGLGLLGHGGLALAIALNYRIYDPSVLANIVFTAAIASVLLTDVFSARLVQRAVRAYFRRVRAATRRWAHAGSPEP